jgi:asparagine synthase (glutamine-hydrolysing)
MLVRDRFGVKPLYYMIDDSRLYFSSEMKPLIWTRSTRRPNREALIEWFLYRSILTSEELIEGIHTVPPGSLLRLHKGRVASPSRYYSAISEVDADIYNRYAQQPSNAVIAELAAVIEGSVKDCLVTDEPVGTLCSGGVDSSLVTALASPRRDITAFHISDPTEPRMDERRWAEEVTSYLGVPMVYKPMNRDTFLQDFPLVIYLNESPLTHIQSVAFYHGAKLAREHGVRVLLVGDAADDVLGGNWSRYGRQRQLFLLQRAFMHLPKPLRTALTLTSYAYNKMPVNSARFEQLMPDVVHMLDRYMRRGNRIQCEEAYHFVANAVERSILATKLADLGECLPWFLQRGDRLGMAVSVEYRVPFLDHRLIKMAVNMPFSYHTWRRMEKWTFKKVASKFLPRHIVYRRKVPWDLPMQHYLSPFALPEFFKGGFCLEVLGFHYKALEEIVGAYEQFLPSFFNLVNLEIWGRLFFLDQTVEQLQVRPYLS